MKKFLCLILSLMMVVSLAACGSSSGTEGTTSAASDDATSKAAEETTSAESDEEITSASDASGDEKVVLTACSSFSSNQLVGIFWEYFCEKVEEESGGSLEIDLYPSGTLGTVAEELSLLSSGSVDMMMSFVGVNAFSVPTMCPMLYFPTTMEQVDELVYYVCYEDETSSKIIQDNLAEYNATLLPFFQVTSQEVFVSSSEVTCWADMWDGKYGCVSDSQFTEMGYKNLVTISDSEWYESLRTGLVDSITCTVADVVTEKLYEVASYYLTRPTYRADEWMLINTDTYNTLSDAQKEALKLACEATRDYAIEYQQEIAKEFEETVNENGGTIIEMTDQEVAWYLYCADEIGWSAMVEGLGGATGYTEQLESVIGVVKQAFSDILGYEFTEVEQPTK